MPTELCPHCAEPWRGPEALQLALILMDGDLSDETRVHAAMELEDALDTLSTKDQVEALLWSRPMPPTANIERARALSKGTGATHAERMLEQVRAQQMPILEVCEAFDRLPEPLFGQDGGDRARARAGMVRAGAFRELVAARESGRGMGTAARALLRRPSVKTVQNHVAVMAAWTKLLDETPAQRDPVTALLQRATEGDRQAMRQLVTMLAPVIRGTVQRVLSRSRARVHAHSRREEAIQEVEDHTQTVLLSIFADRARALLQWDPARRLTLEGFVELLTKREVFSILRSRRRNPWTEDPIEERGPEAQRFPVAHAISRARLQALAQAMRDRVSPRGAQIFDMLFIEGLPVEEVSTATGLAPDAVRAWQARLTRLARESLDELTQGPQRGEG
jgi:RNA polymerase sigma-70 factor (ECF subfamily)